MHAFGFDDRRPAPIMIFRPGFSLGQQQRLLLRDQIGVFAMGGGDDAQFAGQAQRLEKLLVGHAQRALVGQEHFETATPRLTISRKSPIGGGVVTRHAHVEGKIARAFAAGFVKPKFKGLQRLSPACRGKSFR